MGLCIICLSSITCWNINELPRSEISYLALPSRENLESRDLRHFSEIAISPAVKGRSQNRTALYHTTL